MILIFDTYGGLCNQMYDIHYAINFCIIYNVHFSFRFSSLREKHDLTKWYDISFHSLFDDSFITTELYTPINKLHLTKENTYMIDDKTRAINWLDKERLLLPQLYSFNKKHIVLRQFWSICPPIQETINYFEKILPCKKIRLLFREIRSDLPKNYNFLHYRYEEDFIAHFQIKNHPKLCELIDNIEFDKKLPIYVAAYQIKEIPQKYLSKSIECFSNVIFKDKKNLQFMNFEELAFIDFLIGKNANQVYGHSNSSFSCLLNSAHNTNFYYNQ